MILSWWRHFQFSREAIQGCRGLIVRHNVGSLRTVSLTISILLVIFSAFPLFIERDPQKFAYYLAAAAIELGVYGYARRMQKTERGTRAAVAAGYLLFLACLLFFGAYIGVIASPDSPAVNFMVFLICSQILFVLDPLWNLAINAAALAIFTCFAVRFKTAPVWRIDVVDAIIAAMGGMILGWHMSHVAIKEMLASQRLEAERNRFEAESIKDDLTGLSNRRDFLQRVDFYVAACQHVRQSVCVIMMDVDHFKLYNDFYGHLKGDQVLQAIGGVLSRVMAEDRVFAARVGGEEFIVLGTENRLSEAQRLALKLRQMVIDLQIPHEKSPVAPYVTASFGLYFLRGGSPDTAAVLYDRADMALYEAKNQGRDRIVLLDSAEKTFRQVTQVDERAEPPREG